MRALDTAQIHADLAFQLQVRRLRQVMHQEHIFRRNGGIGLEFIDPMPIGALLLEDRIRGGPNAAIQAKNGG